MIGDGEVLPASLLSKRAGKPTLADTGGAGQQEAVPLADPVTAGELEEEPAIEPPGGAEVGVLDLRVVAQPCGAGACLEALLAPQRRFVFEKKGEPFAMFEGSGFGLRIEVLEAFGHAMKAEFAKHVEGGLGQHGRYLLNGSSRDRADWRGP